MNEGYPLILSRGLAQNTIHQYLDSLGMVLGVEDLLDGSFVISVRDAFGGILQAYPMATRTPSEYAMCFRRQEL